MMVSLGAIDKMGHMWGPEDNVTGPLADRTGRSRTASSPPNADEQVGRIVDALKRRGLLDDTLIVITAELAAQTGRHFHGRFDLDSCNAGVPGRNSQRHPLGLQLVLRDRTPTSVYLDPSPAVAQLRDRLGPATWAFSYQDGHVAAWLTDNSLGTRSRRRRTPSSTSPNVIASYHLNAAQNDYTLFGGELHQGPHGAALVPGDMVASWWTQWRQPTARTWSASSKRT